MSDSKTLEEREAELVDAIIAVINEWIARQQEFEPSNYVLDFHVARALLRVTQLSGPPRWTAISRETMRILCQYDQEHENEQEPGA